MIVELLILMVVKLTAYGSNFTNLVRTGSKWLKQSPDSISSNFDITLGSPFDSVSSTYSYALSFQRLEVDYDNSTGKDGLFAILLESTPQDTLLTVIFADPQEKAMQVRIRYLIVMPSFRYLTIVPYAANATLNGTPFALSKHNPFNENKPVAIVNSSSIILSSLTGFIIQKNNPNNITLSINVSLSGPDQLEIYIYNDLSQPLSMWFVSMDIILYDADWMMADHNFTFITGREIQQTGDSLSLYYNNTQNVNNNSVFYGIYGYQFQYILDSDWDLSIDRTSHGINLTTGNHQKADIAYIIFNPKVTCPNDQLWSTTHNMCYCPTYLNYSCAIDCFDFDHNCKICSLNTSSCIQCYDYYQVKSANICQPICGDGIVILGWQQCDDKGLQDGDGCSALCTVEPYYSCTNQTKQKSICTLDAFTLKTTSVIKDPLSNSFWIKLTPWPQSLTVYTVVEWQKAFWINAQGLQLADSSYEEEKGELIVKMNYNQNFELDRSITLNFSQLGQAFRRINSTSCHLEATENNLALVYFSEVTYKLSQGVNYVSYVLAAAALLLFLLGYLGAKLVALESIAIFQLVALLQYTLSDMTPTFDQLLPLRLTLGATTLFRSQQYGYEEQAFPPFAKAQLASKNSLQSINIFLGVIAVPLAMGFILKAISKKKEYNSSTVLAKAYKSTFGTFTFYGIMLLAYGEILVLAINLRYLDLDLSSIVGIVTGALYSILLIGYLIASGQYPLSFGCFRKAFEKYTISSRFYTFSAIQRAVTCFLIAFLSPFAFTPLIICIPLSLEGIFIIVKKPYVLDKWRRPLFSKAVAVSLCLLYFGAGFLEPSSPVLLYMPIVILMLLTIIFGMATYSAIIEIRQYIRCIKQKMESPPTTQQCNEYIMGQLQKRIINMDTNPFRHLNENAANIKLVRDRWDWQNYTRLYSINLLDVMKKQVNRVKQEEEDIDEGNEENIKQKEQDMNDTSKNLTKGKMKEIYRGI